MNIMAETAPPIVAPVEVKTAPPPILSGEQIKANIDTSWDRLTESGKTGTLWNNPDYQAAPESNILRFDMAAYETALKDKPELIEKGIYREAVSEPGKPPLPEKTTSDLIGRVLEECKKYPNNAEIQQDYRTLQERVVVHGVEGETEPITLEEWEKRGKPTGELRFKAQGEVYEKADDKQPKPTDAKPETPNNPAEKQAQKEALLKNIQNELGFVEALMKRPPDILLFENVQTHYQRVEEYLEQLYPGIDIRNPRATDQKILMRGRYVRNARFQKVMTLQQETMTPEQINELQTDINQAQSENQLIESMLNEPIKLDTLEKDFKEDGQLGTPEKRVKYLKFKTELGKVINAKSDEWERIQKAQEKDAFADFSVGKMKVHLTKSGMKSFGKNVLTGAAFLLWVLEQDAERQTNPNGQDVLPIMKH